MWSLFILFHFLFLVKNFFFVPSSIVTPLWSLPRYSGQGVTHLLCHSVWGTTVR
ncbi:hypothetical protein BDV40DRAFT_267199 [Aspergillus tamarii]|uniref:Uncharacterized protein n=1 Tax=Aspergillus tamarii TaxID=41984 RepID=A0A5N6USK5_ASPTM|nr:hypothetical protein BDV40DRAFT_267199 [Aspergillus tamarii]